MTTATALLACVLLLGNSTLQDSTLRNEPTDPMPTKASRAALVVDTSHNNKTIVLLPPQAKCDRLDAWAAQISDLLERTGRTESTLVLKVEAREQLALAIELRQRISKLLM